MAESALWAPQLTLRNRHWNVRDQTALTTSGGGAGAEKFEKLCPKRSRMPIQCKMKLTASSLSNAERLAEVSLCMETIAGAELTLFIVGCNPTPLATVFCMV
ncbi:hypothetical protein M514_21283 [Trichuris suis]|uniref:Uncharacterized protein n=1 Tax=Trichuris suis TaxID=68888 RepID=A0A085NAU9_9BILA|nr:hypothetical protein M514_21283 [Trichuris suis]